jgi:hypothetical protein
MTTESTPPNDDSKDADLSSNKRKLKIGTQRAPYVPPVKHRVAPGEPPAPAAAAPPVATPESEAPPAAPSADVASPQDPNAESTPLAVPPVAAAAVAEIPLPEVGPLASTGPGAMPSLADMGDDLEAEIAAALGDMSLDDIIAGESTLAAAKEELLELGTRVKSTVLRVHRENVFFGLGVRNEGIASLKMFGEGAPEVGTQMAVIVASFDVGEGLYEVHIPGAATSVADWSDISEGVVIEVLITGHNKGGLECEVSKIRGFIPASHISLYRVDDLEQFVGQNCLASLPNPIQTKAILYSATGPCSNVSEK